MDGNMRQFNVLLITTVMLFLSAPLLAKSLIANRENNESKTEDQPFVITPHKVNYIFPVTYQTRPNELPYAKEYGASDHHLDNVEAKFQISLKLPLLHNLITENDALYFGYTSTNYWQVYNAEVSGPFRSTDHEPELFWITQTNGYWQRYQLSHFGLGLTHQSNGKSGSLSRSWNRIYGLFVFDFEDFAFSAKAWYRIPENEKTHKSNPTGDDNPQIENYLGNVEFTGVYGFKNHRFSAALRNNLRKDNKGSIELTWSYPILGNLRFYAQFFNGYGESLIDFDHHNSRIGLGVALNDVL